MVLQRIQAQNSDPDSSDGLPKDPSKKLGLFLAVRAIIMDLLHVW
jgi:hypothetical protein